MWSKVILALCAATAIAGTASAEDITGTILIKRRLTKPSVTTPVSVYQRGMAVKPGRDGDEDPIAYERTRVVLYLEGPGPTGDDSASPALQVQQVDRRFLPDLVVVPVGSTVSFPNMDPIFHNIYSLSKPKTFDLGSYDKGATRKVVFPKSGVVDVYCHLHPDMTATIIVTPNRWYARPDRSGKFRIPGVPPGQYTVVAWHKSAGFFRKSIVVESGHDAVADFFIPVEAEPKQEAQATRDLVGAGGIR
jgi:plastocyanin